MVTACDDNMLAVASQQMILPRNRLHWGVEQLKTGLLPSLDLESLTPAYLRIVRDLLCGRVVLSRVYSLIIIIGGGALSTSKRGYTWMVDLDGL